MKTRKMAAVTLNSPTLNLQFAKDCNQHGVVIDEIEGLIKVYRDGYVERPQIVPSVTSSLPPELGVSAQDVLIDNFANIWARFYVPQFSRGKLPLMVYFHGGGFCVGSPAWSVYHDFLARLSSTVGCVIMSVNYRLAPENPLPAAYDDGVKSLIWLNQQAGNRSSDSWWAGYCDFSNIFLAGDSAGANIVYNVLSSLCSLTLKDWSVKGAILIQPFFGGEGRTSSEKFSVQSPRSALSLAASDTYWRLALPRGANRDHPWCNPAAKGSSMKMEKLATMVCVAETDILKDRSLEFVDGLVRRAGKKRVECVVHKGVGHAFQILNKSQVAQIRTFEMMSQIKNFVNKLS